MNLREPARRSSWRSYRRPPRQRSRSRRRPRPRRGATGPPWRRRLLWWGFARLRCDGGEARRCSSGIRGASASRRRSPRCEASSAPNQENFAQVERSPDTLKHVLYPPRTPPPPGGRCRPRRRAHGPRSPRSGRGGAGAGAHNVRPPRHALRAKRGAARRGSPLRREGPRGDRGPHRRRGRPPPARQRHPRHSARGRRAQGHAARGGPPRHHVKLPDRRRPGAVAHERAKLREGHVSRRAAGGRPRLSRRRGAARIRLCGRQRRRQRGHRGGGRGRERAHRISHWRSRHACGRGGARAAPASRVSA